MNLTNLNLMVTVQNAFEEFLKKRFKNFPVLRVDSDSTRKKNSLENYLGIIKEGKPTILLGTQLLAKGHHFPDVTLVGIVDADSGLFSADFRGSERVAQLMTQVAGRAGRDKKTRQSSVANLLPRTSSNRGIDNGKL